jgi:hypothetical protein
MPESDEHKALVEREVRTCARLGASVETEVRTARGRRRADFIAVGAAVTLAGEIQLTNVSRRSIGQRQRDLTRDGNRALWTTDSRKPAFLDGVPRLVIPALSGWQQARNDPELAIIAGWWLVEYQRCGWSDAWSGDRPRCPCTGSLRTCGRIHAYPTRNATMSSRRPHLDIVVGGIVTGEWLPYKRRVKASHQFEWIPAKDYERVVEDRGGGDPERAERSPGTIHRPITSAERTCDVDATAPSPTTRNGLVYASTSDGWADHPRFADVPRCTICGQPMFHPESISLGVCARHRPSRPWVW